MRTKKKVNIRNIVLSLILTAVMVIYTARVFNLQVINRNEYLSQVNGISERTAVIKAARGEILDAYGRPIAVNRDGFNVVFNKAYLDMDTVNDTIISLTDYFTAKKQKWVDNLPITDKIKYDKSDKSKITTLLSTLELNSYATAQNCFDSMVERYELEGLSQEVQRTVMGVRYSMEIADFSVSLPYTFAEDVSEDVMSAIYEYSNEIEGVEISTVPVRDYQGGDVAVHLIGNVGSIQAEDWEKYKKAGYSYDDKVGTSGVEYAYEEYLHGTDGEITYKLDNEGNIISSEITKEAIPGNTVILSLDKTLQLVAQKELSTLIDGLREKNSEISGGSVVVSNVKSGNILASATYPTYTMEDYEKNYTKLATDENKPLLNRAFMGTYPPGSCFKPAVASIGLYLNKITSSETVYCKHVYDYYSDVQPTCMGYHGSVNTVSALSVSCNSYFYELGRRIGIKDLNKYCLQFGLGAKTGVEVPESAGILAGSDYSASVGATWTDGMTLSAAIGQSDNMFTPLQLCMYTSTIANNGIRYKASLLSKIMSYSLDKTVYEYKPTVLNKVEFGTSVYSVVKEGMLSVTTEGTGSTVFDNYDIKVGGKSGTAENPPYGDHSVFIAFAPYDSPEIAISVVIEHGLKSYVSASLIKAILNAYFFNQYGEKSDSQVDKILQ